MVLVVLLVIVVVFSLHQSKAAVDVVKVAIVKVAIEGDLCMLAHALC